MEYELMGNISLMNVLNKFEYNLFKKMNCVKVGKIKTFYSDKQTADIEIDGYPQISDVPVHFISGANFSIQVPVEAGDDCIILFCDTDLDNWVQNGSGSPSFASDLHGLNGAVCLVGLKNLTTKIDDYITNGVRIKYKGSEIELTDSGIVIKGNVTVQGTITSTDIKTDSVLSLNTHIHSGGTIDGNTGTPVA